MLEACQSVDAFVPDLLLHGLPIVGPIARSRRWPVPVQAALDRAWDLRKKIVNRVRAVPASDNLQKIWGATIEDVEEGSTLGPFTHPDSRCLSSFDVRTGSRLKDSRSSKRTKFAAATAPQQT